ncbi:translation elongation factor Ts [Patescibacteria group bacterium]
MTITADQVKKLRDQTGVGMMEAKKALDEAEGDMQKAIEVLRKAGQKIADKKQDRTAAEGVIGTYVHANNKVAAMVVLNCETDFVARTDDFKNLAHDIAMQVAATKPEYLNPDEIPADVIEKEKQIASEQSDVAGKPDKVVAKIIEGKLQKFYSEICLLQQPFIKDDSVTIEQLVQDAVTNMGENIQIREFTYISI